MNTSLVEVREFVRERLRIADAVAKQVNLKAMAENTARSKSFVKASEFRAEDYMPEIPLGFGAKSWAAILFVDLRKSSERAEKYSERDTYLTMHGYLPTMAFLVGEAGGVVVGYRGDGLFAGFGLTLEGGNSAALDEAREVQSAVDCGKSMIEAVDDAVEPELIKYGVPGGLQIGCGVDASKIVLTRIGLKHNSEVTAYGHAVNKASKLSGGNSEVVMTSGAKNLYPTSKSGRMKFARHTRLDGIKVDFPADYQVLKRSWSKTG